MKLSWLSLILLTDLALAEQTIAPPRGWNQHSRPSPHSRVQLRIGLVQPQIDALENHLWEISDPDHERYGQHLSKASVEKLVAPRPESVQLEDTDVSYTPARDWVIIDVPVSLAEDMLDTNYHVWVHDDGSYVSIFSIIIDLIQPTTMFARFSGMKTTMYRTKDKLALVKMLNDNCNRVVTLECLEVLYNTSSYSPQSVSANSIGITGYLGQYANKEDLKQFYADQKPDATASFTFVQVNGGLDDQSPKAAGDEANLDVQFALGLSYPTPGTFWSTGGEPPFVPDLGTPSNTNEPYANWLDYILKQDSPPATISTSYGDHEQTVPEDYARRTCRRLLELSVRGVTLIFSSGDGGVGDGDPDPNSQTCKTNDGRNETRFLPVFPSVTSVGGTQGIPEKAAFFSGGGFIVDGFLEKLEQNNSPLLNNGLFNRFAFPDVSAQALNFRVFIGGNASLVSGTSAAAPTVAGIVALLNDVRLHAGLSSLGFLNPLIYKNAQAFNDITEGSNPGCGTEGFNAIQGWDPITGLGTPDFNKLKKVVQSC
ncbi:subtilisin-like protein [Gymnopus androsaceus JB14]|uniref:tripeptidyl-peptidase II n=1 Tax=Gymnopus androsaceus JB14 TaxID=1447944 RepID=A0A6A4GLY6_9AGAR|nr:subtilisin-like protein [Gymnopus androsaceus JB14]